MGKQLTKNFNENEFRCKHCGELIIDLDFIKRLQKIRTRAGIPLSITSGYRCPVANQNAGGKSKSAHMLGKGVDIYCTHSYQRFLIVEAAIHFGFKRIGLGENFVHIDSADDQLPTPRLWLYY